MTRQSQPCSAKSPSGRLEPPSSSTSRVTRSSQRRHLSAVGSSSASAQEPTGRTARLSHPPADRGLHRGAERTAAVLSSIWTSRTSAQKRASCSGSALSTWIQANLPGGSGFTAEGYVTPACRQNSAARLKAVPCAGARGLLPAIHRREPMDEASGLSSADEWCDRAHRHPARRGAGSYPHGSLPPDGNPFRPGVPRRLERSSGAIRAGEGRRRAVWICDGARLARERDLSGVRNHLHH